MAIEPGRSLQKRNSLEIEKIKEASPIESIVGEYVSLKKSGKSMTGLCPFHSERTPSFNVNPDKGLFYCYGCDKGGDVIAFLSELHGWPFYEVLQFLAGRAGIKIQSRGPGAGGSSASDKNKTAFRLNRFAASFFRKHLEGEPRAQQYLRDRGVDSELEKEFYIGWTPSEWDSLAKYLQKSQAPFDVAENLGLLQKSKKPARAGDPGYFDLFRSRVVFPVLDTRGHVAGFGGRLLELGDQPAKGPKYLNSPESSLFKKSQILFGLFQARKHIREQDLVVVAEGYFDVLALHRAGIKNAVATCGTSLSANHIEQLKRIASRIVVLFDGDEAGIRATVKAMETALPLGEVLYGARCPAGQDPDDLLNTGDAGKEQLRELIRKAEPILDRQINEAVQSAEGGAEDRTRSIKAIAGWLIKLNDSVGVKVRIESVAQQLSCSPRVIEQALRNCQDPKVTKSVIKAPVQHNSDKNSQQWNRPQWPRPAQPLSIQNDISLLKSLAFFEITAEQWRQVESVLPAEILLSDLFEHPELKKLLDELSWLTLQQGGKRVVFERFEGAPVSAQISSIIAKIQLESHSEEHPCDIYQSGRAMARAIDRAWARFSQKLKAELAQAEALDDRAQQNDLLKDYLDVQRKIKEFSRLYGRTQV